MKKLLFTFLLFCTSSIYISAQCLFEDMQYASGVAPATIGQTVTISTCNYYGEHSPVSSFSTAYVYTLDILDGGYITVFDLAQNPVSFGPTPHLFTPPSDGDYLVQWSGPGCMTDFDCHETSVTNSGASAPCVEPADAGNTQALITSACLGQTFNLTLGGASSGSGLTYQWQSSIDGITYSDIVGQTSSAAMVNQVEATYYQCIVTCSGGASSTSTPLFMDMGNCLIINNGSETTCDANFFDSGGPAGNYMDNEMYTFTVYPASAGSFIQVNFSEFNLETCCDYLEIYNGNSTLEPLIGMYVTNPGGITSSAADGSLTFNFYTDGSVTYSGWAAAISCVTAPANDECSAPIVVPVDGSVNTYNNGGASVDTGEDLMAPPATGSNETDGWANSTLNRTTWFTFDAPSTGNLSVNCTDIEFPGRVAIYSMGSCSDYTTFDLVAANDDALDFSSQAPKFTICGLTPGETYILVHDSDAPANSGQFSIQLSEINVSAGETTDTLDVCSGGTVDLFNGLTGNDMNGTWTEIIPTVGLSGSDFNSAGLAYQVFEFNYYVEEGCMNDMSSAFVHVFGPSSAGEDGTITVCRNAPLNLVDGLNGTIDLGGTWYDPSQNVVPSLTTASNIPGQFNYFYITGNGVCPDDTSLVVVSVDPGCNYLGLDQLDIENISVYPNPSEGLFYISVDNDNYEFDIEVTDIEGRLVLNSSTGEFENSMIKIDLSNKESGIYFMRLFDDRSEKVFRVVKK